MTTTTTTTAAASVSAGAPATSFDPKVAVNELARVDREIKAKAKDTAELRRRSTELKAQIAEHMRTTGIDEIESLEDGLLISLVEAKKVQPLAQRHVVDAVTEILQRPPADGERVFAAADKRRPTILRSSLKVTKLTTHDTD